jgi:hypothetical protein
MTVSIDTSPVQYSPGVSIDTGASPVFLPEDIAEERARKASIGTGGSYDEIKKALLSGQEEDLRNILATDVNLKKEIRRNRLVVEALAKGNNFTPDQISFIETLSGDDRSVPMASKPWPADPKSVIEETYAHEYMRTMQQTAFNLPGSLYNEIEKEEPMAIQQGIAQGSEWLAKIEMARTAMQDGTQAYDQQGWGQWLANTVASFVPFRNAVRLRGNVEGVSAWTGLFQGKHMDEQAKELLRKPFSQFRVEFPAIFNRLKEIDPALAIEFAHSVYGMSSEDIIGGNIQTAFDLSTLTPLGGIAKTGARNWYINKVANDMIKAAKDKPKTVSPQAAAAAGSGDLGEAAVLRANDRARITRNIKAEGGVPDDAVEALSTGLRADKTAVKNNPGNFGQELVNRITENINTVQHNFMEALERIVRVRRIPLGQASLETIRAIKDSIKDRYPGLSNRVLDVLEPRFDPLSNTWYSELIMGQNSGTFFSNKSTAENAIKAFGLLHAERDGKKIPVGVKVDNQGSGLGWYIRVRVPVDETEEAIRDMLLKVDGAQTPGGLANAFVSWLRSPDDTLSYEHRLNRKLATYGPSVLRDLYNEEMRNIKDLVRGVKRFDEQGNPIPLWKRTADSWLGKVSRSNKNRYNAWKRVIEEAKKMDDPETGAKGYFFKDPAELEYHYMKWEHRLPDQTEIEAYFTYKKVYEMDRVARNLRVLTNKLRLGVMTHQFTVLDGRNRIKSEPFDGVVRKEFPGGEDTILVVGKHTGEERLYFNGSIPADELKVLREGVEKGKYHVVELYDPELRPFSSFGTIVENSRVRYVITESLETRPLSWEQVPRRGGGHFDYDYDFYIKQAIMVPERIGTAFKDWYEGDRTLMPIALRNMGRDVAEKMNKYMEFIRKDDWEGGWNYIKNDAKLPFERDELEKWFKGSHDKDGKKVAPRFNMREPFVVVPKNKMIIDMNKDLERRYTRVDENGKIKSTFQDGTRRGSLARMNSVEYTGARDAYDLYTFRDKGTAGNPVYNIAPAEKVDAISSLNRGLNKILNSTFVDDYKIYAVEHWVREAAPWIKADDIDLAYSPYYYFHSKEISWKSGIPEDVKRQLEANRFKIKQFVGIPSSIDALLYQMAQKMADAIYSKYGSLEDANVIKKGVLLTPAWLLPKLSDPIRFMRSVAFDMKLGMFSLPQLWVQSQTYTNIWGIAGAKYAGPGTFAAMLSQFSRINSNPRIIAKFDKLASYMGWKPGEFTEALKELKYSGFGHVGGEYAMLADHIAPKIAISEGRGFLNAGRIFFREGERNSRLGAWFTAFREFRDANPTGRLTALDKAKILERADTLNMNMSAASNSALHSGVLSLPTQFLSYQIRAAELFLGKRLGSTPAERWKIRARMVAWNSALYGLPVGVGISGVPFGDIIRKEALSNGYQVGENYLSSFIMEGPVAMMLASASADKQKGIFKLDSWDPKKGNWWNFGERFGNQGFTPIREALREDNNIWELVGGAAGSIAVNTLASLDPFWMAMKGLISGDKRMYNISVDNFIDIAKEVASINKIHQTYVAWNTGHWLTKNGLWAEDVSKANALFMGMTGLQNQNLSDLNSMAWTAKGEKEYQNYIVKLMRKEADRAIASAGDPDKEQKHMNNVFALLELANFPYERRVGAVRMAFSRNQSLIDRMKWQFAHGRNTPTDKTKSRMEMYEAFRKLERMKE